MFFYSFAFTNARSIVNKVGDFTSLVNTLSPIFVCVTETWLTAQHPTGLITINNYVTYRRDRGSRGGGVMILIDSRYDAVVVSNTVESEIIAVDLKCKRRNLRIIVCYIPNSRDYKYLKLLFMELENLTRNVKSFAIFGDFNFPDFDWTNFTCPDVKNYNMFKDFLLKISPFEQIVKFSTRGQNTLDLILTNSSDIFSDLDFFPPLGDSDHLVIVGTVQVGQSTFTEKIITFNDFKHAPYDIISIYLENAFKTLNFSENPYLV